MKDILGLIKYILIMAAVTFLSQVLSWLFNNISKFDKIFPQINKVHSIIFDNTILIILLLILLVLLIPIIVYFIKLPIVYTQQAIKNHWSKYLNFFFNNFFLMTLALILIRTGSKIFEPEQIINILNLNINASYISSFCSHILPVYFIIYLTAILNYPSKEITNAPKFIIQLNKIPKWVIFLMLAATYLSDISYGYIYAIITLILITLLLKIRYTKMLNLALPADLTRLTHKLPTVSSPYVKDLMGLIKYLLIMAAVTFLPKLLRLLFIFYLRMDEICPQIAKMNFGWFGSIVFLILLPALSILLIISFYFIIPIDCTKQAIKNHWSKYLNFFFNNFFLMTLALILIYMGTGIGILTKTINISNLSINTFYIVEFCLYISPIYFIIYATAILNYPAKEITNAPKFVILLNKIPKWVILTIFGLFYLINILTGFFMQTVF